MFCCGHSSSALLHLVKGIVVVFVVLAVDLVVVFFVFGLLVVAVDLSLRLGVLVVTGLGVVTSFFCLIIVLGGGGFCLTLGCLDLGGLGFEGAFGLNRNRGPPLGSDST